MTTVNDFRLKLRGKEYLPVIVGGMGVDISAVELALEACRLGGIGHISDAMIPFVSDKYFKTHYTKAKTTEHKASRNTSDKSLVKFNLDRLYEAQIAVVTKAMNRKQGSGAIWINVMEKLTMGAAGDTLGVRLNAAMDAGVDGITLSAGLHNQSLRLMAENKRFHSMDIGIIVSSLRALKIFLRSGRRVDRIPDYVIVEGPLAGGHLGFGEDWADYSLKDVFQEVLGFVREENLPIAVIPAGGVFTGTDAKEYLQAGAGAVQVATRFTVTKECGLPEHVKQKYFEAHEENVVVNGLSATGYLMRMLSNSPCLGANVKPQCEPFGYILSSKGTCLYIDAYDATGVDEKGKKLPVMDKMCTCYHFSKHNVYTCGHYVYRLKDTTNKLADGSYQLLTAEHVFNDYLHSSDHKITLPPIEEA
ncbi:MAG: nitronate monooxygenase [Gammaproteobacteria bacterium]|nr:nitronate monooxygenase [Gammaproteobacteria bacterium]